MRKVIAAINMTLDGYCDHTAVIADDEIHDHYTELLRSAGVILYGRITYQLMEFWPPIVKNPTGNKAMDEFARVMDNTPKIVFSHTLKNLEWASAKLATKDIKDVVAELKQSGSNGGKDVFAGSRSLIVTLLNMNLIDEFQLCVHPVIAGKGLPLLDNIDDRIELKLLKTKTFGCGAVIFYYQPVRK